MNSDLSIHGVIETGFYVRDLDETEAFYRDVLGLKVVAKEPGRHVFFQAGAASMLLAFIPEVTLNPSQSTPHGAKGPGHFALGVKVESLDAWRQRLNDAGIAIEEEVEWPRGGRSIYFRDPSGNCVELITPGVWGLPSGW